MYAFSGVSERLHAKSVYHHFDTQFAKINLSILTAYDQNGVRQFEMEDFVNKNDPEFSEWSKQLIDDIKNDKIDYTCPYFWDRWELLKFSILNNNPRSQEIAGIVERCRQKKHSANGKKSWIKRKKLPKYCKLIDELLPLNPNCHLNDESWADIFYNAFLLESSTGRVLNRVNDSLGYGDAYEFLTDKTEGIVSVGEDLNEFLKFAKFFQKIKAQPKETLTAQSMIEMYQLLVPNGNVRTDENYLWRGKIHQQIVLDDFLEKASRDYQILLRDKHPLIAIATLFFMFIVLKPFYQYNEIFAIAILNLELRNHGYPTVSIRRRDMFFIENCHHRYTAYHVHEERPQTYQELVLYYVFTEMNYLQDNVIVPSKNNKYLNTNYRVDICQEHFDWWNALPTLWQRIFLVCANHQDKLEVQVDKAFLDSTDVSFYLSYPIPNTISDELLQKIFQLTHIAYDRNDVNPSLHTVVHSIPPLHYFKHLQYLSLQENYVEDLSGLAHVETLKYLDLYENCNDDNEQLKYVGTLKNLEYLELSVNFFTDVSPLTQLTNLTYLSMWGGARQPIDISGFENLQKLITLDMDAPIDMSPLASLKQLKDLSFGSDEYEFDDTKIDWLLEQLPDCDVWFDSPTTDFRRKPKHP
ncbi:leucine-rich repeat domain-containing protein [Moraxella oblonga]|uniref:leucine-rich repeat domain-containing protein n=1 Tax=Moraxella oblonga TaxID=200413 RepID=UPI000830C007|nr:leucine-rich repeat domain-containing protein [Moraxella oblonga]